MPKYKVTVSITLAAEDGRVLYSGQDETTLDRPLEGDTPQELDEYMQEEASTMLSVAAAGVVDCFED